MSNDDEFIVLGLCVHAVISLHVVGFEDRVVRVEDVLLSENLHDN